MVQKVLGRICSKCREFKTWEHFPKSRREKSGYKSACKVCHNAAYNSKSSILARSYGLTMEEFDAMLAHQGGLCLICREPWITPVVDHCHTTGGVRGLLCSNCNIGLGHFRDNPAWLRRAADYLEEYDERY